MTKFGERLKILRHEMGVTQRQCAERLGVGHSNYNKWENGVEPNYETLCSLADFFKVDVNFLIGYESTKTTIVEITKKEYPTHIVIDGIKFRLVREETQ